MTVFVPHI